MLVQSGNNKYSDKVDEDVGSDHDYMEMAKSCTASELAAWLKEEMCHRSLNEDPLSVNTTSPPSLHSQPRSQPNESVRNVLMYLQGQGPNQPQHSPSQHSSAGNTDQTLTFSPPGVSISLTSTSNTSETNQNHFASEQPGNRQGEPHMMPHATAADDESWSLFRSQSSIHDQSDAIIDLKKTLILDFRTSADWENCHLASPCVVHVLLPTIFLQRASYGAEKLETMLPTLNQKLAFRCRHSVERFVFIPSEETNMFDNRMKQLMNKLIKDGCQLSKMFWLECGFKQFASSYSAYCTTILVPSPFDVAPEAQGAIERGFCLTTLKPRQINSNDTSETLATKTGTSLSSFHIFEETPGTDGKSQQLRRWPVEILPFIYLGDEYIASQYDLLADKGINTILCVSTESPKVSEEVKKRFHYHRFNLNEDGENLLAFFPQIFSLIEKVRLEENRILVHCVAGKSRSVAMIMLYLVHKFNLTVQQAMEAVSKRSPEVMPSLHILGKILKFSQERKDDVQISPTAEGLLPILLCHQQNEPSSSSIWETPTPLKVKDGFWTKKC